MSTGIAIVIAGLLISGTGVVLAWAQKGAGTWAAFAFGFLLVLIGGPLNSRLDTLSVSASELKVSFISTTSATEEHLETELATISFLSSGPVAIDEQSPERMKLGNASREFQRDLSNYLVSLGFTPIQPVGAELLVPGTIVRLEEGRPVVWASASEAFGDLKVSQSAVALPEIVVRSQSESRDMGLVFECAKGSTISEASLLALTSSLRGDVARAMVEAQDLRVVQSTLVCADFTLKAYVKEGQATEDQDKINYGDKARLVLGVRLAAAMPE